jgi:hypothetical protein
MHYAPAALSTMENEPPAINAHIADLYNEIQRLEQEIDDLLLEKIQSGG